MPKLKQLFDIAIQSWIKNDPRWEKKVKAYLEKVNKDYKKLEEKEKKYFDKDYLLNPYIDSKIHYWDDNLEVKKIIVWIDVEWQELLLVNEYNKKNPKSPIDLVFGHHPEWKALIDLWRIMEEILPWVDEDYWVPINQTEKLCEARVWKIDRSLSPLNYTRSLDYARLLDIPYFGIHTPADNNCHTFFENIIEKNKEKLNILWDLIDLFMEEIPEMDLSKKRWMWPLIWNWTKESSCGKIAVVWMTGWTSWDKKIYEQYAKAWIWTILLMHIWEDHLEEAKKYNLNVIVTDHMASDSLWINLILDEYEKLWVEILEFSGFMRVSRV